MSAFFETANALMVVLDRERRIVDLNPAAARMTGYAFEEIAGQPFCELFLVPEEVEAARERLGGVFAGRFPCEAETCLRTKAGERRRIAWAVTGVFDPDGAVEFAVCTGIDVTESASAAAALRETNDTLATLIAASPVAIVALDLDQRVTLWNPAAERLYGWTAAEVLGKPLPTIPGERRDEFRGLVEATLGGAPPLALETQRLRRGGMLVDVLVSNSPLRNAAGEVVGTLGVQTDISSRRRAEEALRRRDLVLQAVGSSAERLLQADWEPAVGDVLRELGEATGVSRVYLFENHEGADGRLLTSQRYEWCAPGIGPQLDNAATQGFPLDAPGYAVWMAELAAGRPIQGHVRDFPAETRPHHEIQGIQSVLVVPVHVGEAWWGYIGFDECKAEREWSPAEVDALKAATGLLGAGVRRRRADEELRRLEQELAQSQRLESVGRLAGGVAHDFNNLLTAIAGHCELLLAALPPGDPTRDDADEILKAAERATALVGQLLAFSRKQLLQPRIVDLNEVVRGIEGMLRRLIGEDVELVALLAEDLGHVSADPTQLEQVIVNLAVNARDAMPAGGRLTIETQNAGPGADRAGTTSGRHVALIVRDTGLGMDEQTRARAFEPFFTTKGIGQGTGLGLATVYGVVSQSGGRIELESALGAGTTFRVLFPHVDAAPAGASAQEEPDRPAVGSETILLVEDEDVVRGLARRVLLARGYAVLEAGGGERALELAAGHAGPIDLLLTDVVMPGMSGRELVDRLAAVRPQIRVLYTSGYTDDLVLARGVSERETAFLAKPFTPDSLARSVRRTLDAPRP